MHATLWSFGGPALLAAAVALGGLSGHSTAWAGGKALNEASAEEKKDAQDKYLQAKKDFDAKRYEEALSGFRASYDIVASPNSHHMMVRCLDGLGQHLDAYEEAVATVEEAERAADADPKYKKTAQAARNKLRELRSKLGLITVTVADAGEDATVKIGGRTLHHSEWGKQVAVLPGTITVQLDDGGEVQSREVTVAGGGEAKVALGEAEGEVVVVDPENGGTTEPTTDDDGSGLRIASYVAGGVGAAGWILFAVGGALHLGQYGDLTDRCRAGVCPPGVQADIDRGRDYQTMANVGVAVGAVGLATGLVLFIASQPEVRFEAKKSSTAPRLAIGPGSVTLKGTF